jgi:hypothetical protein
MGQVSRIVKAWEVRSVANRSDDYERWREAEASRLIASGCQDTETVRDLLILSCHSSPLAHRFFEDRLGSAELLRVLLALSVEDYSGDAQMTASYWVSQFPPDMLAAHIPELETIAANEWDSVAVHARQALADVRVSGSE